MNKISAIACWLVSLYLVAFVGCTHKDNEDAALLNVESLIDQGEYQCALSLLDSIPPDSLSEENRHFRSLLEIKASDKAYIVHTTDSLILDVIDFYSHHKGSRHYAEALYYGGRVNTDLANYPKAIEFYERALEILSENSSVNLHLKCHIMSQYGRLLGYLGLHTEAIHVIGEAIEISGRLNDSINLVYDNLLISGSYIKEDEISSARHNLSEAMRYSDALPDSDKAWIQVALAEILMLENKPDSALLVIKPQIPKVDSLCLNYALLTASEIYLQCGLVDSAWMFTRQMIERDDNNNKEFAYRFLMSDDLIDHISPDSIRLYLKQYKKSFENSSKRSESAKIVLKHLHNSKKADQERKVMWLTLIGAFLLISLMTILICLWRRLQKRSCFAEDMQNKNITKKTSDAVIADKETEQANKAKQQKILLLLELNAKLEAIDRVEVSDIIRRSSVYKEIRGCLEKGKAISGNEKIWSELSTIIKKDSPDFITKLNTLTCKKITKANLHTAFLIRCGFSPSDLAILFSISKSSASDRRSTLSRMIFEDKKSLAKLDLLIGLL